MKRRGQAERQERERALRADHAARVRRAFAPAVSSARPSQLAPLPAPPAKSVRRAARHERRRPGPSKDQRRARLVSVAQAARAAELEAAQVWNEAREAAATRRARFGCIVLCLFALGCAGACAYFVWAP